MELNKIRPGGQLPWTSPSGDYGVVVRRTDAGQTWTVELLRAGRLMVDEDGVRQIWTHSSEKCALEQALFAAEGYRDLERVQVVSTP